MCCLYGEKVDLSVQKFTNKSFQVWAGKQKRSASKGADFVKVRCSEGIKKIPFNPKIYLETFFLTIDTDSRGKSRSHL